MRRLLVVVLLWPCVAVVADDDLIYRWQFRPSTFSRDHFPAQVGALPAKLAGDVSFSSEQPRSLQLDGKTNRLIVATDHSVAGLPSDALTVSAWVRIDEPREWGGVVSCLQDNGSDEHGWLLGYRDATFCFGIASVGKKRLTYLTSRRMFEPGYWYHLVGTYDGQVMRLYVDGRLAAESREQSGAIDYPPQAPFTIGAYEDKDERFPLKGAIEQVSLWKRSLDADEVARLFGERQKQFPDIIAIHPEVADWPTHLRDNQRTGLVTYDVSVPLHLQWVHEQRYLPSPAWPAPATQDFWHKKFNLKARVVYDRASHLVAAHGRVFLGSSADDSIRCVDLESGETVWQFFTEGPVRLAPTIAGDRVLAGSDDGHVYCLEAATGRLIWKRRGTDRDARIAGNERIISMWPIRTGVLVEDSVAYFCAGLFPQQGVYQVAVDLKTGRPLGQSALDVSAQGYLARRAGRLFVATGRDPAGAFVSRLKRTGKGIGQELAIIPERYRDVFIGSPNLRFGGGDGEIAAFAAADGRQLWHADVEGKVWSMALVGNRLLASTDTGRVYCFGPEPTEPRRVVGAARSVAWLDEPAQQPARELANRILQNPQLTRGYALVLNGTHRLSCQLAHRSKLQVICYQPDAQVAAASREAIDAAGLAGRVAVHVGDPAGTLPYADYLFNVVVDEAVLENGPRELSAELVRVTRPLGGLTVCGADESNFHRRASLPGTGEWSHMYANPANTVCSNDALVGSDLELQWFGRPGPQQMLDRHHRTVAPLWKNGRLIIPGNDRVLGVDAYNGTLLWNLAVPGSRRIGAYRDSSYLAAAQDSVYVAARDECLVVDAETGVVVRRIPVPAEDREWGYLAVDERGVLGTASRVGAIRRDHSLAAINEGTFWDERPLVTSDKLFQVGSDDRSWSYLPAEGVLVNSSLTVGGNRVFVVESTNPATAEVSTGRVSPRDLFSQGSRVTAIDRDGGSVAWSVDIGLEKIQHNLHCAFADGKLVVVGSRNSGGDKKTAEVLYDVFVLDAASGEVIWKTTQRQGTKIGGDHGEQDHHPVIVGDTLYCEPFAYRLQDGQPLKDFAWAKQHRRGCGTVSASASAFYFRQSNPTLFDLRTGEYQKVTAATRPGCWINMIPAGGLLLIPEASSGCTCNYAIQTSLAFRPRRSAGAAESK